jgi:hypothetical protein
LWLPPGSERQFQTCRCRKGRRLRKAIAASCPLGGGSSSGRVFYPRDRSGGRVCQHCPRPRALLRPTLTEGEKERVVRHEPARDGPQAVADLYSSLERYYGFRIISGNLRGWDWFGHSGGLQGYVSQTRVLPEQELALSVLTNANDGFAHFWLEGAIHILRAFAQNGGPLRNVSGWTGGGPFTAPSTSSPWERSAGREPRLLQSSHGCERA